MPWGSLWGRYNPPLFSRATSTSVDICSEWRNRICVLGSRRALFPNLQKYIPNLNKPSPAEGRELDREDLMLVMEHRPRQSFLSRILAKLRH